MSRNLAKTFIVKWGGGIAIWAIIAILSLIQTNIYATELSILCTSNQTCTITTLPGRLTTNQSGSATLDIDFDRLTPKSDIFTLMQNGEIFIVKLNPQYVP